jgi:hypothetical protein
MQRNNGDSDWAVGTQVSGDSVTSLQHKADGRTHATSAWRFRQHSGQTRRDLDLSPTHPMRRTRADFAEETRNHVFNPFPLQASLTPSGEPRALRRFQTFVQVRSAGGATFHLHTFTFLACATVKQTMLRNMGCRDSLADCPYRPFAVTALLWSQ